MLRGFNHLLADLDQGKGKLAIKMTDPNAFAVGENIATTPGKVVYQNDLLQLIQYEPTTEKVYKTPLLIIPPWINKFYILDLQPKNSFIKWAVDQGLTVFVVSWVNPDERHAKKTFEDYMLEGPLAALDAIEQATGEKDDQRRSATAWAARCWPRRWPTWRRRMTSASRAATFFTTLTDFEDPGELGVFIDEEQLASMDEDDGGSAAISTAREMATTFNMLRANDLIWSFVINNYLLGKEPFPFDLALLELGQHAHAPCHAQLLSARKFYQENKLVEAGRHQPSDGVSIDLAKKIRTFPPICSRPSEDHIAPLGLDLRRPPRLFRSQNHLRAFRIRPYRRRGQPGRIEANMAIWLNDKLPADPKDWMETADPS